MAPDSLNQVGRYIRQSGRQADLAIKRVTNRIPKRERARDTVSSLYAFNMVVISEGKNGRVTMDINFNKPPPDDCSAECISTTCEAHELGGGAYSIPTENPYVAGTVKVFSQGLSLPQSQWYEENEGQVYVQVQSSLEMIIICYSYIIC